MDCLCKVGLAIILICCLLLLSSFPGMLWYQQNIAAGYAAIASGDAKRMALVLKVKKPWYVCWHPFELITERFK